MNRQRRPDPEYQPGEFVVDSDADDPDLAVVLNTPGATCIEWDLNRDDPDGQTVADANPEYDDAEPVVLAAYVSSGLDDRWPGWIDADPDDLYIGAMNAGVKMYAFPESKLEPVTP